MHTVCETFSFQRAVAEIGMTDREVDALIKYLAEHPMAGDEIVGTGGCRKLRVAGRGKGKSGGYRTITFYSGQHSPVYLITVFSKGRRSDLSQGERNHLKTMTKQLAEIYEKRVVAVRGQR